MTRPLALADTVATLRARFAATAAIHDESGAFPHENFALLHEAGLLALTAPAALGGRGAGLAEAAEVIGGVAAGEPSTALILTMQYLNLGTLPKGRWPAALVARVVADAAGRGALVNALRVEPQLGTPARGGLPATIARRDTEGWRISGRKTYATGIEGLTWAIVWARTDEAEPRVGAFLVPAQAPGIRIERTWATLGMRATGSHDAILEDVLVPAGHAADLRAPQDWAAGEAGQAVWLAVLFGALYDGIARAARDWIVHFLKDRAPASLGAPLATLPRMQEAIGAIEERLAANARLIRSAARDADEGRPPPASEANLLKVTLTETAIEVVERATRLAGNHAIARSNPLERHLRDVLCGRIHTPQEDMARIAAGRIALA